MPKKEVNVHVRAQGVKDAKQQLDSFGKSGKRVGQQVAAGQKQAAAGTEKATQKMSGMARVAGQLKSTLLGLFGGAAAIAAVTKAIQAQSRAVEEHSKIVLEQQNKLLRLQFLGDFFTEKPELRKEVMQLAEFGRRPFEQVADAWYNLKSKGAGLTDTMQKDLLREALEYGRTDPSAPLDTLVDMFSLYAKQTHAKDANRVQNVIRQTVTEAGSSTSQAAQYMPQFLPVGMSGGLSGEEAAGLWAYVTTQFAEPAIATTGLRSVFMALQGKGTPESGKLLKKLGVKSDMSFFEKLSQLATQQQKGEFSLGQAELIAQKEGAATLLSLIQNPEAMMKTVGAVVGVGQSDKDLTKEAIDKLFGSDEVAAMEEMSRLFDIQIKNIKARDIKSVKIELGKKLHEKLSRERGLSEFSIDFFKKRDSLLGAFGLRWDVGWSQSLDEYLPQSAEPNTPAEPNNVTIINDNSVKYLPTVGEADLQRTTFEE